jgi:hypothetical protein
VLVVDHLTANAALVSALPMPDKSVSATGEQVVAFNMGDIPPLSAVTATLMLSAPTVISDFIDLDTGASTWGTLQGHMVSAQARINWIGTARWSVDPAVRRMRCQPAWLAGEGEAEVCYSDGLGAAQPRRLAERSE